MELHMTLAYRVVPKNRAMILLFRHQKYVTTNFVLKVNYLIAINLSFQFVTMRILTIGQRN